jgi:hypothetical protein
MSKYLFEYLPITAKVLAERQTEKGKEVDVLVKWQHADQINANGRLYPRPILEKEIKRIQAKIDAGESVYGHPSHPKDGVGTSDEVSHIWRKVWMEKDGSCLGELSILPTSKGRDIAVLVSGNRKLGLSSRGFGQTKETEIEVAGKKQKALVVQDDFVLATPGDWAIAPSVKDCGNITEEIQQLEKRLNEEQPINIEEGTITVQQAEQRGLIASSETKSRGPELTEKELMEQMENFYKDELNQNHFRGSFEQFRCRYEEAYRIEFNLPENPQLEELKKKVAEDEQLALLFREYRRAGGGKIFTEWRKAEGQKLLEQRPTPPIEKKKEKEPDYSQLRECDVYSESLIAGVSPRKMLEILKRQK